MSYEDRKQVVRTIIIAHIAKAADKKPEEITDSFRLGELRDRIMDGVMEAIIMEAIAGNSAIMYAPETSVGQLTDELSALLPVGADNIGISPSVLKLLVDMGVVPPQ